MEEDFSSDDEEEDQQMAEEIGHQDNQYSVVVRNE